MKLQFPRKSNRQFPHYFSEIRGLKRKNIAESKRVPAALTSGVKEAIKRRKAAFRKWKSCPNEKSNIRGAKKNMVKTPRQTIKFFQTLYIQSRESTKGRLLDHSIMRK